MKSVEEIKDIERIVLGYILNNPSLYIANYEILSRDLFRSDLTCKAIMDQYKQMSREGLNIDLLSLSDRSKIDLIKMSEIYQAVDYNVDFKTAVSNLVTSQTTIGMIQQLSESANNISQGYDIYQVIRDLKDYIQSNDIRPIKRITQIDEHIKKLITHMEGVTNGNITGIRTGLNKWDEHTGGLQPSDLVVIAAETSQGKTSLALSIAYNSAINHSAKVAIFSLEMSEIQLVARLTSIETGMSSKKLLFHALGRYEWETFNQRLTNLPGSSIYIDDCSNSNIDYIISGIKIAHMQHGIQVAIVDYLQLVKDGSKKSDESEIASNTRRFKNIAKELNITVILLSQLRREQNPKPTINRLRGSGQIEEAADIIALLWRPEFYNIAQYDDSPLTSTTGTAEIIIAKGRNYGVGKFWLNFEPKLTYFTNIEYGSTGEVPTPY